MTNIIWPGLVTKYMWSIPLCFVTNPSRRRLATSNRSRISVRVTNTLARTGGVVNPVKLTVCAHVGGNRNLGTLWPATLGWGVANPLKHTPPHIIIVKSGDCMSNGMSVITEIRRKIVTSRVPPFEVTQGHWNRHRLPTTSC